MKRQSSSFITESEIQWEVCADGVKRQIMGYDDSIMIVKVDFERGSVGAIHQHPHSQSSYVASGKFEVTINGKSAILSQGDSFYVPPAALHGVVCLEEGLLIDAFSPCREDFLS